MSDRPMTRNERARGRRFDAAAAVNDVNAAYQQNGRPRPPMRHWCPVCHADYSTRGAVDVCQRSHTH